MKRWLRTWALKMYTITGKILDFTEENRYNTFYYSLSNTTRTRF